MSQDVFEICVPIAALKSQLLARPTLPIEETSSDYITHELTAGRKGWVQVADGTVHVNDILLNNGDGLAISGSRVLTFSHGKDAEFLFFDLAP